jgi:hypothetical protein
MRSPVESMSRNQLIIQLPLSEGTDFDRLLHVEETLMNAFSRGEVAQVDGHDMGPSGFNILITVTGDWDGAMAKVDECLARRGVLAQARIARRVAGSDDLEPVRPGGGGAFAL